MLCGGEVLFGLIYVKLLDYVVQLLFDVQVQVGVVIVSWLWVGDFDVMQFKGVMVFNVKGDLVLFNLSQLQLSLLIVYQCYGWAWLVSFGLCDMMVCGQFFVIVDLCCDGLNVFIFIIFGLDLVDVDGWFVIVGLKGGFDWSCDGV